MIFLSQLDEFVDTMGVEDGSWSDVIINFPSLVLVW